MIVGSIKENLSIEKRVSITPETAKNILNLGLIDEIIPEPLGGAHRNFDQVSSNLSRSILKNLDILTKLPINELVETRYERLMSYGSI